MVVKKIEKEIFQNSPVNITLWKRYVDDVFAVIPSDEQQNLLAFINQINTSIIYILVPDKSISYILDVNEVFKRNLCDLLSNFKSRYFAKLAAEA